MSSLYQASEATPPGGNQTLDNIRRVTDARDSFLNYRYRDENGDMIMVNLYDISDTDPADILGDDVVDVYDDEQVPLLFIEPVIVYRVIQQVPDLGWVNFDLDVPLILPRCSAHSAYLSSAQAESGRESINQNPYRLIPGPRPGLDVGQGLHLTAKIQERGYSLGSLRLKPRFETKPELYFILRSPKPSGSVWTSDRFNRGLV